MNARETLIHNKIDLKKMIEDESFAVTNIAAIMEAYHKQKLDEYCEGGKRILITHPDSMKYVSIDKNGNEVLYKLVQELKCPEGNFYETHQEIAKPNYKSKSGEIKPGIIIKGNDKDRFYAPKDDLSTRENCRCGIGIKERSMEELGTCTCNKCGLRC